MRAVPVLALTVLAVALSACVVTQVPEPPQPARPNRVVMGYYPSWLKAEFGPAQIAYGNLTHIAHAFVWPDASGKLVAPAGFLDPALNAAAHEAGVKMILSVGGWGHCGGFPGMSATAAGRARFIGELVAFCRANAYDGVDIDWEFVSGDQEKAQFTLLIEALGAALKARPPGLLLTMAAPSRDFHGRWIDFERLADDFDYFGFMTYDYHGAWSGHAGHNAPLYASGGDACGSLDETFRYALGRRVPPAKVLVGLPFFGRTFDCGGLGLPFTTCRNMDYKDIAELPPEEWVRTWDGDAQAPLKRRADGTMTATYDDMSSISLKCQYVKDKGAAGVIIWALGGDARGGHSELLEVVGRSFGAR